MAQQEYIVNLDLPANERWSFLSNFKEDIDDIIQYYLSDFKGADDLLKSLTVLKEGLISDTYLAEIDFIASISKFSADEILMANLYYDIMKFYFGCTAFAIETDEHILHARNLDWWTESNMLSTHSKIFVFQKNGKTLYKTVSWAGFIGALSGVKPKHFSITLNAVLSSDPPQIAMPISFFLRDVLEEAGSYEEAKKILEETTIASDCLLLLTGTQKGQMSVIERTPTRHATRSTSTGYIAVTNDYKLIDNNTLQESELQATSCGRFERAIQLIQCNSVQNSQDCFAILKDQQVKMDITVQQMVFTIETGEIDLILT